MAVWHTALLVLLLLILEADGASKGPTEVDDDPDVDLSKTYALGSMSLPNAIRKGNWFLMFYAPWCSHCKRLKPVYAALSHSEEVQLGDGMRLGMIDCTEHKNLCGIHGVKGYPNFRYVGTAGHVSGYCSVLGKPKGGARCAAGTAIPYRPCFVSKKGHFLGCLPVSTALGNYYQSHSTGINDQSVMGSHNIS